VVDLSEINLKIRGCDVTLRACVRCEKRWWHRDGEPVVLGEVLDLMSPPVAISA
jgi:hypothetical protein